MRNATISTSRTRAASAQLIDYRPLPAEWGDREALRAVRVARRRAAVHGGDPSTLQPAVPRSADRERTGRERTGRHRAA